MEALSGIVKGALIGVANIIPGVSGGTMAVSLGVFDRLIFALTDIRKNFRKSMAVLLPIAAGCAIGIVCFTYIIEFLLGRFALPTCMLFMGLIFGGVPMLWRSLRKSSPKQPGTIAVCAVVFLAMFAVSGFLPLLGDAASAAQVSIALPVWFLAGMIASASMVIPGVSGSMVLMILGYYYTVLGQLKNFFDALRAFDLAGAVHFAVPLFVFGVGVLLGIFLVAKCIRFLFERVPGVTYSAILGLVAAAPIAMLYNTGALSDLSLSSGSLRLIVGAVLLCAAFLAVYHPDRKKTSAA